MSEQTRQLWIGIAMDLMVAYDEACDGPQGNVVFLREMCQRVAEAVGDDATTDFAYEILQRRLKESRDSTRSI